jgi:glucosyl-3-phosphoglycerate synthase
MLDYKNSDFLPLERCIEEKKSSGLKVSVVIPTLNEMATIGNIVSTAKKELMDKWPLVDEIIVMDGNSTDSTVKNAELAGARVICSGKIATAAGFSVMGKGLALWESLFLTIGDIVVCIDADILNFSPKFIYGLVGPFFDYKETVFAKAYYSRPLKIGDNIHENYGGRVTEIFVRPFLSAFAPELAEIFQPLSGEYAFLKKAVDDISFSSGYGVEIGLIFDLWKKYGLNRFAQVDMGVRYHRNRPVRELGKMSFGIMQTIFDRLEQRNVISKNIRLSDIMVSIGENGIEKTLLKEIELPCRRTVKYKV